MNMKRWFCALLALLLALTMVAGMVSCERPDTPADDDSQHQAEELAQAKENAKETLEAYANADDYREEQKAALATAITDGKTAIDAAATTEAVSTALNNAKQVIDAIQTDAALTAEELAAAKTAAKETLEAYANAEDYREEQKTALAKAIADGKTAIDAATSTEAVNSALDSAKLVIDAIQTDGELTAEELASAKQTAKDALSSYGNADDYREAQKKVLSTAIADGKTAIDAATDIDGVNTALANAKSVIDAIPTDAEITAKEPTIRTTLAEGKEYSGARMTADFWVYSASGAKLADSQVTVTVNGVKAGINWSDSEKTSYNLVFADGKNTVVVTATDGEYSKSMTYTVTYNPALAAKITVCVEGFTVGLGYIVKPYILEMDDLTLADMAQKYGYESADEMKDAMTAAYVLDYVLSLHDLTMEHQGDLPSGSGFYMESMSGFDTSDCYIPEALGDVLGKNGFSPDVTDIYKEGTLGEFDITWGSGWMYAVNNAFPNVGFCDWIPQDGDVMRVQFTLAYGSDIGGGFFTSSYFESVNRDELTTLIAKALLADIDVTEAVATVSKINVTQAELDAAVAALKAAWNR